MDVSINMYNSNLAIEGKMYKDQIYKKISMPTN
jgi:hypothetical protein